MISQRPHYTQSWNHQAVASNTRSLTCCPFYGAAQRCKYTVRLAHEQISSSFNLILYLTCSQTTGSIFHRILRCLSKWVFFFLVSVHTPLGMKPWSCTLAIQILPFPISWSLLKLACWSQQDGPMGKNPTAEPYKLGFYLQTPPWRESFDSQKTSLTPVLTHICTQ